MSTPPSPPREEVDDLSWAHDAPVDPWPLHAVDPPDDADQDGWIPPAPPPPPLPELDGPDDRDDGSWDLPAAAEPPPVDVGPDEPPVVPWSTQVRWVEAGRDLPAVLDPTCEQSVLTLPDAGPTAPLAVTLRLGPLTLAVTVAVCAGSALGLRLGRDALTGRVHIRV